MDVSRKVRFCVTALVAVSRADYAHDTFAQALPVGAELLVNTKTSDEQRTPAVAADGLGNFIVVWKSAEADASVHGSIRGQRFDPDGSRRGTEFEVSGTSHRGVYYPHVAAADDGSFVIVWTDYDEELYPRIRVRTYDQDGNARGAPFQADSNASYRSYPIRGAPAVADGSGGEFMVVWPGGTQELGWYGYNSDMRLHGRRIGANGRTLGAEFTVGGSYWTVRPDIAPLRRARSSSSGATRTTSTATTTTATTHGCARSG